MKEDVNLTLLREVNAMREEINKYKAKIESLKRIKDINTSGRYHIKILARCLSLCTFLRHNKNENIKSRAIDILELHDKLINEKGITPIKFVEFNQNKN